MYYVPIYLEHMNEPIALARAHTKKMAGKNQEMFKKHQEYTYSSRFEPMQYVCIACSFTMYLYLLRI